MDDTQYNPAFENKSVLMISRTFPDHPWVQGYKTYLQLIRDLQNVHDEPNNWTTCAMRRELDIIRLRYNLNDEVFNTLDFTEIHQLTYKRG